MRRNHLKVLVVDDDEDVAGTFASLLTSLGYEPAICQESPEALARITQEHFDLLLTDFDMPELNGLELVQRLRDQEIQIPAIMISGAVHRIDPSRASDLDIVEVVAKPVELPHLAHVLKKALCRESASAPSRL